MKILITGSHFTPAQAVIQELKKITQPEIVYVGRKHTIEGDKTLSVESQILPKLDIKFIPLTSGRLQRSFSRHTIPSLLKIPLGFIQAFYLVMREKPNVVLSFGGYTAVPVVVAAWLMSIPIIIHEQTLVSGLANEISSWFASKIAVSFADHSFTKKKHSVVTGNPLRQEMLGLDEKTNVREEYKKLLSISQAKKLPLILITGGNQGSHIINKTVGEILKELTKNACVLHQTGDSKEGDFEKLITAQQTLENKDRYLAKKWIEPTDLNFIFQKADLVISRAGINTLVELAYFAIPVLLIPIPYLYKDEQNKNAQFFNKIGLAEVLPQSELNSVKLLSNVEEILGNLSHFKERAKEASGIVIPDAAKRLALETVLLAKTTE